MPLKRWQQHRNNRLQALRAQLVRSLPQRDQCVPDVGSTTAMDLALHALERLGFRPQQPDCVFPMIAGDRDKLVEDLGSLGPATGPDTDPRSPPTLPLRGHADPPRHAPPSSSPVGSIAAEATDLAGNNHGEAMRGVNSGCGLTLGTSRAEGVRPL